MSNNPKPITIIKEEFTNGIINTINSSQLPLFIVEYVLKDILNEVHIAVIKQLQEDKESYNAVMDNSQRINTEQNDTK